MTTDPAALRSGKGHRDENFPVASRLIHPRHRGIILAFYEFVRIADNMADHARLPAQQKLDLLDRLEAGLLGRHDDIPEAVTLRLALSERGLSPRHAQDLLTAFRMDVTKLRYHDWDDLMHYCSYSAMPVGRFVLDVHGEDRSTWPATTHSARRCRSSTICRTAGKTIVILIASMCRSMRSPPQARGSRISARTPARRRCEAVLQRSPSERVSCSTGARHSPPASATSGSRSRWR